jgi:hypothetical protein
MSDVKTINGPMRDDGLPLFRKQWNESCKAAGLVSIGKDTAAKLLAIVYVLGGEREDFTHNEKLKADLEYIQDVYGFQGGEVPNQEVAENMRGYVLSLELEKDYPQWATKLMQEQYGIKL